MRMTNLLEKLYKLNIYNRIRNDQYLYEIHSTNKKQIILKLRLEVHRY